MKSWKKKWKDELDQIAPILHDDVKNAAIPNANELVNNGGGTMAVNKKLKIEIFVAVVCVAVLLIVLALTLFLLKSTNKMHDFLVVLEINPTITLAADKSGIVTGVISSNADADVLFSDEKKLQSIKNKKVDIALKEIVDSAAQLGYIDLDSTTSAIRISGCGNEELLTQSKLAVENYFMQKGVFALVLTDNITLKEFCTRSGLKNNSLNALVKTINQSEQLFYSRNSQNMSLDDLKNFYDQIIVSDKLWDFAYNCATVNFDKIIKNAEDVKNLSMLYWEIFNHADNPMKPYGDYWLIRKLPGDSISGDFATLVKQMDNALIEFKSSYNIEITSAVALKQMVENYVKIPISELDLLLKDFSLENFKNNAEVIGQILTSVGLVDNRFIEYLSSPISVDEFKTKINSFVTSEYQTRFDTYLQPYNKPRQPIEAEDYLSFKEGIISDFGSLEEYWQSIHKK